MEPRDLPERCRRDPVACCSAVVNASLRLRKGLLSFESLCRRLEHFTACLSTRAGPRPATCTNRSPGARPRRAAAGAPTGVARAIPALLLAVAGTQQDRGEAGECLVHDRLRDSFETSPAPGGKIEDARLVAADHPGRPGARALERYREPAPSREIPTPS